MHAPVPKLPATPPVRLAARRSRGSASARRPVIHIVLPGLEVGSALPRPRETITAFLRRSGWAAKDRRHGWQFRNRLPTIALLNGEPVLRAAWRTTRLSAADSLQFISRPLGGQGGGGKQIIGLVALIALAAFATPLAGALLGTAATTTLIGSVTLGQALAAGIVLGGSLLINALIAPKPGATNDPASTTDQIYSVQAQGNVARLGQPLPVGYGREKRFPDLAAMPWGEFVGNDQYQNILLCIGMGEYDYEQLYVDDTPFWDAESGVSPAFSSVTLGFYKPGDEIDLFPINVASSSEVTGQQLPDGTGSTGYNPGGSKDAASSPPQPGARLGPYSANPPGTQVQSLAVDFVFPAGCFTVAKDNNIAVSAVRLWAEYQPINDAGVPTGPFQTLFDITRSYTSRSPIRDTVKVDVPPGRYAVSFRRGDAALAGTSGSNTVVWAGLRAFLKGNNSFPDVSTIAIRIKATESTQGSFKFGVLRTRRLPVWNGASFVTEPTRNAAWAFYDAVTNTQYGAGHALSKVDFNAIVAHAAGNEARGDCFDYLFDSAVSAPEAFDKILAPSRARHYWMGDTISLVRDEYRDVPAMLLTDREIVRDSTQISWTMLGEDDPDAVILEYVDEETWRPAQVQYPPESDDFTALNPDTRRVDGILNRGHAFRECAFYYLQSIYRRENVQIATEYEGRALTLGQTLRVQSELPMSYGQGGAVTSVALRTLTLSPAPSWSDAGPYFVRIRRPNGRWFGPVNVVRGMVDNLAVLDAAGLAGAESSQSISLAGVLAREPGGEDPSFELGTADNQSRLCVLLSGQPNGSQCTLNLVVDDPRVHATDLGDPPVLPTGQFPADQSTPVIAGLNATFGQGIAEPKLMASWFPPTGAFYYVAEVSYDSGQSWSQVYEGRDNQLSAVVTLAPLRLRVQGIGRLPGPYSQLDLAAPTIAVAAGAVTMDSLTAAIRTQVMDSVADLRERIADAEDVIDILSDAIAQARLDKTGLRSQTWSIRKDLIERIEVGLDGANAFIETVQTVAVNTQAALASYTITTNATLSSIQSQVTTNATAYSTLNAAFASYQTTVTAQFGATNASISSESIARANQDSALSGRIDTVTATANSNTAAISSESIARANQDSALSGRIDTVTATANNNTAAISSESVTRANQDSALSGRIDTVTATANSNTAAISSESATRANQDSALSGRIDTVTSTVGGHTASLQLIASSVNGSSVYLGLIGTIDGVSGGLVLTGVGQNGVVSYNLRYDGNFVVNGSLTVTKLAVGSVDFNTLVQGAATNPLTNTFPYAGIAGIAGSNVNSPLLGSITATTPRGFVTCELSGEFLSDGAGLISLLLDGVVQKSFSFTGAFSGTVKWTLSGLSNASHTFAWRATIRVSTGTTYGPGQTTLIEYRN